MVEFKDPKAELISEEALGFAQGEAWPCAAYLGCWLTGFHSLVTLLMEQLLEPGTVVGPLGSHKLGDEATI